MDKIILASASPRRKELLEQIGLSFEVRPAVGEEVITAAAPEGAVLELAFHKAEEIAGQLMTEFYIGNKEMASTPVKVIGADTIVVYENQIYGKPASAEDACRMLTSLQGNTHQVYTGVCVMTLFENQADVTETQVNQFFEKTDVTMYSMTEREIKEYVATGDPLDKAGAYGIQGPCAKFIKAITGDYYNVVGLPIGRLYQECFKDPVESTWQNKN